MVVTVHVSVGTLLVVGVLLAVTVFAAVCSFEHGG